MKQDITKNMTIDFSREEVKVKEVKEEVKGNLDFDDKKEEVKKEKELLASNYAFVVVDIETTGLEPKGSRITEIVALRYDNGGNYLHPVYHNLLNPTQKIPKLISDLTGITQDMVKYKPFSSVGAKDFLNNLDMTRDILIAHNAAFELKWLKHQNKAFGLMNGICTRGIYLYMRDGNTYQNNYKRGYSKLKQVCEFYGIEYKDADAHRAEYDVLKTKLVAERMIAKLGISLCLKISEAYVNGKGYGYARKDYVSPKRRIAIAKDIINEKSKEMKSRCAGAPIGPEGKNGKVEVVYD